MSHFLETRFAPGARVLRHSDPAGSGPDETGKDSAVADRAVPKRNKRVRPRTYSIAVYIVVGLLIAEIIALFSIFHFRRVVINISTQAPPILAQNPSGLDTMISPDAGDGVSEGLNPLVPEAILNKIKPQDSDEENPVSVMNEPNAPDEQDPEKIAQAREEAKRLKAEREAEAQRLAQEEKNRQIRAYVDQSVRFLREEDFANAKRMLQRALSLDRNNVETLQKLAMLTNQEGRPNEAIQYWRRIVSLGPEAGEVYSLAKEEVASAEAKAKMALRKPPVGANQAPAKKFMIRGFEKVVGTDPKYADQVKLNFDVALNGVTRSELDNLFIEFFFYDISKGKVLPGAGEIKVVPVGDEAKWLDDGNMHLEASYQLDEELAKSVNRRYHGYLLRIYLNKQLQDEQAEPVQLLELVEPTF